MDDLSIGAPLAVLLAHPTAIKWMPSIVHDNFSPDMGRMTPR